MSNNLEKLVVRFARFRRLHLPRRVRRVKKMSRHPFAVPFFTFTFLITLTLGGYLLAHHYKKPVNTAYVVIISHDHTEQVVPSRQPTVGTLLKKLNLSLNQGDVVEPNLSTRINQDRFRINIYRAVPVKIIDGGKPTYTFSAATTPRSIAKQAGFNVYPEDQLQVQPVSNFTKEFAIGETVSIKRSVPIQLILYGTPVVTRSHSTTVGELVKEKHITLAKGDTLQPTAETPITPNQQIFVLREGTKIVTETRQTPAPVQTVDDAKLSSGTSAVRQAGSPSIYLVTYQVDEKTGAKTEFQSVLIQAPVTQIVARGTAPAPASSSLSTWLLKLRMCESHGNYQDNTGNGYYGAYQFSPGTWNRLGTGYERADLAPPSVQDQGIVTNTNRSSGGIAGQNPGCYRSTGISAFPPPS